LSSLKNIFIAQFLCVDFLDLGSMRISDVNPPENGVNAGFQIQIPTVTQLKTAS
jgi:hypothetical protein